MIKHRRWLPTPRRGASHFDEVDVEHRVLESWRPVMDADLPDADVVVATWFETAEWVARLSPIKGAKAYYIQLDERAVAPDNHRFGQRVAATWRLPLYKIATSHAVRGAIDDEVGDSGMPVVEIGVDMQQFYAAPRGKQRLPRIGFLYEDNPRKRPEVALRVEDMVRSRLPGTACSVLSSSSFTRHPLPPGTLMKVQPSMSQLRELYAGCDVWLCTSRCEGFHLPPMEAMACRCPVVATRVGGPVDMIQDGVNGFLLDVDDVSGLSRRVLQILSLSDADWRSMSDAAHATATRYTWDDATVLFEQALWKTVERTARCEPAWIAKAQ